MRLILLAVLVAAILTLTASGQVRSSLIRELLDLPAPAKIVEKPEIPNSRSTGSATKKEPPADNAPIEDLLEYWKLAANTRGYKADTAVTNPSAAVIDRLLDHFRRDPQLLDAVIDVFPKNPEAGTRIAEIYFNSHQSEGVSDTWRNSVKKWLKFNTDTFLSELLSDSERVRDQAEYGSVLNEEELRAFVRLDRERAQPLLKRLAENPANARAAVLARVLQYEHAIADKDEPSARKLREELKETALDRNAPAFSRDAAIESLLNSDWDGRDDWYISLYSDESLRHPSDGYRGYSPLASYSGKDPKKWLPVLVGMLGNQDRSIHNAAVQGLMEIESRESLMPLLPWLSDPDWAEINVSPGGRTSLIQLVSKFDIRESIPGLIWAVENDDYDARWAAGSLEHFKDDRAGPALKRAALRVKGESDRSTIVRALIACDGLTVQEQVEFLERFVRATLDPELSPRLGQYYSGNDRNPLPAEVSIGKAISEVTAHSERFIRGAIERETILRTDEPDVAKAMSRVLSGWKGRLIDLELLSRLKNGDTTVDVVIGALARRAELAGLSIELMTMSGDPGFSGAVSACLLGDTNLVSEAVFGGDDEKKAAALACARLLRIPLDVASVGTLLNSKNNLLSLAAERYLESEDSPEARELVLGRFPNEVRILGARTTFVPAGKSAHLAYDSLLYRFLQSVGIAFSFSSDFKALDSSENRLRDEIRNDPKLERIFATLPNSESGAVIVRVYADRATLTIEDDRARFKEKTVSKRDLDRFLVTLNELDVDNFYSKFVNCHYNCYAREFVALSRSGGRRIFSGSGLFSLGGLDFLESLFPEGELKTHYKISDRLAGVKILLDDEVRRPIMVWKHDDDVRVLISDEERRDRIGDELAAADKLDGEDRDLDYDEREKRSAARRSAREFEHLEWRSLKDVGLGPIVPEPNSTTYLRDRLEYPTPDGLLGLENRWQARWGRFQVTSGEVDDEKGLWLIRGNERRKIATGWFGRNVVVQGDWALVAKTDTHWGDPNYLVRVNLKTGREHRIAIEPAGDLEPVATLRGTGKVLVYRSDEEGATIASGRTYFSVDLNSGRSAEVKGEFRPLYYQDMRPLQKARGEGLYWATVFDRVRNETEAGLYDARSYTFKSILRLPEVVVTSDELWVDENGGQIFFVYSNYRVSALASVPLPKKL